MGTKLRAPAVQANMLAYEYLGILLEVLLADELLLEDKILAFVLLEAHSNHRSRLPSC